jgi:hypothetical protein
MPIRQQVQVWHGGQVERWHALILSSDSVSGVPFVRPADCDSCRLAVGRAEVDSIRVGQPVLGFWKTAAVVLIGPIMFVEVVCAIEGHFPSCWPTPD